MLPGVSVLEFAKSSICWPCIPTWAAKERCRERAKWSCLDCLDVIVYRIESGDRLVILGVYHGARLRPGQQSQ
jgi:hypothetical protein